MLLLNCEVYDSEKSRSIKEQEVSGLLRSLSIKTSLSKMLLVGRLLFSRYLQVNTRHKMNEVVNKFLLAGDKFMPQIYKRQHGFTYSACGPFIKHKERTQKFKETGDLRCIYKNELDKAWFLHDMAYGDFKDLPRRTACDKILYDEAFNIAKNPKFDGYQRGLALMAYNFFDKMSASGDSFKNENISNQELAEELHKPIIGKFEKRKVHLSFMDNIWGVDLADIQFINKVNKGIRFLLRVINIFSKYAWVVHLQDKVLYLLRLFKKF